MENEVEWYMGLPYHHCSHGASPGLTMLHFVDSDEDKAIYGCSYCRQEFHFKRKEV